jgi:DNA repair exonuclease SbcCD ATPase subunit
MKIKSIYIDGLHNAVNKTYQFGDIAYLFGRNGVGKSTVLQAIQLALLGYIPGTAKNSREALLRHSPRRKIVVRLTLSANDNDVVIERAIDEKATKVSTIPSDFNLIDVISELEIPIFNFNEFVGQTANKLKEYFIKNILPTSNGSIDWHQILTESILDCNFQDRDEIIDYGMGLIKDLPSDSVLDQVIAANEKFKAEQSFNKSELQRLQNTIDSLIYYDDYVGPTNLQEIESNLLSLNAIRDQLIKYTSAENATRAAKDEYARLEKDINDLGGKNGYDSLTLSLAELKQQYSTISAKVAEKNNEIAASKALDQASTSIINSKGVCPYTKEECKSIANKIDVLRNEAVERKAAMLESSAELDKLNTELNSIQISIRQTESKIQDFQTTWNRLVTIQKTMGDLPQKPNTEKSVMDLDIEITNLTNSKTKLEANIKYNETIDTITKLKFEAELQGQALANWVKKTDTNGLQTTLMIAPFDELAKTMTGYIQQMYGNDKLKAHFNISNKANSFSFGLIRDGIYIPYDLLSSGEKCLYTLALMICITHNNKSPLKLMLCDDMFDHLDSESIESTFTALRQLTDIQFVFAGVKDCEKARDIMILI